MTIFYCITMILSLLLLGLYFIIDKKRNVWLMLLFISISVCNIGYFLLSISTNITFVIISNDITYLGSVFLPFFMLMLVLNTCNINFNKRLTYSLIVIGVVMLFITTSIGYLPIYYKSISLEEIDGVLTIVKEYGPLHILYTIYIVCYFMSMIGTIIYSIIKRTLKFKMQAIFISIIVLGNIFVWIIEKFTDNTFEFLSATYIFNEFLLLLLYGMIQEYGLGKLKTPVEDILSLDFKDGLTEEQISYIFTNCQNLKALSTREKDVLKHILLGERRKEIGANLFISESAVRKHTTNIFKKLEVINRNELFEKLKKSL